MSGFDSLYFPSRFTPQASSGLEDFPYEIAADLRVALLRKLLRTLRQAEGSPADRQLLEEVCESAEHLLGDAAALYRGAIAQAQGRETDD